MVSNCDHLIVVVRGRELFCKFTPGPARHKCIIVVTTWLINVLLSGKMLSLALFCGDKVLFKFILSIPHKTINNLCSIIIILV